MDEKVQLNFTISSQLNFFDSNFDPNENEFVVNVSPTDDIRIQVQKLIESLPAESLPHWLKEVDTRLPFDLAIYGKKSTDNDSISEGFLLYGKYHLGGVEFLNVMSRAHRPWTVNEFRWLREQQLLAGTPVRFQIVFLQGLGASGGVQDWIPAMFQFATTSSVLIAKRWLQGTTREYLRDVRNSKIMSDWKNRGLDSVDQLDELLATRASWKAKEISSLLSIWQCEGKRLLANRGFQVDAKDNWIKVQGGRSDDGLADLV